MIFETMQLHTNNLVNKFKSQTFVRTASAYMYRRGWNLWDTEIFLTLIDDIDELRPLLCDYRLVIDRPMPIDQLIDIDCHRLGLIFMLLHGV